MKREQWGNYTVMRLMIDANWRTPQVRRNKEDAGVE
jgi:hypothetical protein